jgi:pimeloyl-ACP methyl ester carboxylesterase
MLYVNETGNPSAPTIVFLHGGGGGGWMWQPQVDALKDAYHILVPDLPEHGRSAAIKPFTIAGSAAHVAELIRTRANGGKAHLVGLSEGAQIVVALLGVAPEVVDRAVVSSALVRGIPGMGWFGVGFWAMTYLMIEPLNKYDWWVRLNMRSYGIPIQFLSEMRETYRSLTADAFAHLIVENQRFRLPAGLDRVTAPTLVVGGKKEYGVIHQSIKDVAAAIPKAKGYLVHHTQRLSLSEEHNWNLAAPELFIRTVRAWIGGQPLPEELEPLSQ